MEGQGGQDRGGPEEEDQEKAMMNGIMPNGKHHLGHGNNQ